MAHLLPRTDFVHLFGQLPVALQMTLKDPDVHDQSRPAFVSLIAELCQKGNLGGTDKPVLGWSLWKQLQPGMIAPDLTRELWAEGIVAGQDRLSQASYLEWLEARKDTLEPQVYTQRKEQSKQLDSLGAWKDKMDKRGTAKLPLVEFRALVAGNLEREMTVPQAKQVGVRLAGYIEQLLQ